MLTLEKIYKASEVLKEVAGKTDILPASKIFCDNHIFLKTENIQSTGSFKVRGAYFKISELTEEEKKRGVIACSAGNHAQGVALAATKHGVKSLICLPEGAPISKIQATKGYGADVCLVKGVYDDAYQKALELKEQYGYTFVHPFDDEDVIAGQGTVALEILEDMPKVDAIVVPIGGGGLISGIAYTIKNLKSKIKVYGVQAEGAPSMYRSVKEGAPITLDEVNTIADGIAVKHPGTLTYELTKKYVDDIFTVSEDEIATAIVTLMERKKMVAEGAGAVSVAAAMFNKLPLKDKNVVCIVSGGNIDVNKLSRVITRGLINSGRRCSLTLRLMDKPGQFSEVARVLAEHGANVISAFHERASTDADINFCYIKLDLETRDFEHIETIKHALEAEGFRIVG
ncbi:MAG TPA: threonine ammonia-lyase [Clostridiales bacterium]|jgi:threonine ammonia-lyase|nr:threonine ammonia-lyase [Subdoligranulum sp.]CDE71168.1 l-threonine ammonia-lyase [Subdoligranulum sp. CAG:314]HCW81792.1 threonine ammonia-lyase [Clostridiales bacterium]